MQNELVRQTSPTHTAGSQPYRHDVKLLDQKLENISTLMSSLNAAVEDLQSTEVPVMADEFDYYNEVRRFEISLINSALRLSGGSQVKAARLLKLNATTLNAKMKHFNLQPR